MSEGHQVIAQDTVTDTIGHSSVKGQDDINFTFTLYSGEDAVCEIHSSFQREHHQKLKHPKRS